MVKSAGKERVAWMVENDVQSYHPIGSGPFPLETGHNLFFVLTLHFLHCLCTLAVCMFLA